MNKIFKIVIQFKKLDETVREIGAKHLVEKKGIDQCWIALYSRSKKKRKENGTFLFISIQIIVQK